jgi:4-amino-4-deoxy-L-arabinose transferase-like glycosyltransferase/tetratricopeptide (TPR) repeat protein
MDNRFRLREWMIPYFLAGTHFTLGVLLLPSPLFTKYRDFATLLIAEKLTSETAAPASPLYLLFHVLFQSNWIRIFQSLAGALTVFCIYSITRRIFDSKAALLSALITGFSAPLLVYEATLEPDLLITAFQCVSFALLIRILDKTKSALILSAIPLGLSFALRPSAAIWIGTVTLWIFWVRTQRDLIFLGIRSAAVFFGLVWLTAFASFTVHQSLTQSELPSTMSPGTVLYEGSRPESTGDGANPPFLLKMQERQERYSESLPDAAHAVYRQFARLSEGKSLSPSECQKFWLEKLTAFIKYEPWAFLKVLTKKMVFIAAGSQENDVSQVRQAFLDLKKIPVISFRVSAFLGLAGILYCSTTRRLVRQKFTGLLILYWASCALVQLLFYVSLRYSLILIPVWSIFGGYFLSEFFEILKHPQRRLSLLAAAGFIVIFIQSNPIQDSIRFHQRLESAQEQMAHLIHARNNKQVSAASHAFQKGQASFPFLPVLLDLRGIGFEDPQTLLTTAKNSAQDWGLRFAVDHYFTALLMAEAKQCPDALQTLEKSNFTGAYFDSLLDSDLLSAHCLIQEKRFQDAFEKVTQSLERHPATLDGLAEAIAGSEALGKPQTAAALHWKEELAEIHDPISSSYALAKAKRIWGDYQGALKETERLLGYLPNSGLGHYEKALNLLALGQTKKALFSLDKALFEYPHFSFPVHSFEPALLQYLKQNPEHSVFWSLRVKQLAREGRISEALKAAKEALRRFPDENLKNAEAWLASLSQTQ